MENYNGSSTYILNLTVGVDDVVQLVCFEISYYFSCLDGEVYVTFNETVVSVDGRTTITLAEGQVDHIKDKMASTIRGAGQ